MIQIVAILLVLLAGNAYAQGQAQVTVFPAVSAVGPPGPVWSCFKDGISATTECQSAPAAGLKNYVTSMSCTNQVATVQTVDLLTGTGANCATPTAALTPKYQMGTTGLTTSPFIVAITFATPLVPPASAAICLRPGQLTAFGCALTGYVAP